MVDLISQLKISFIRYLNYKPKNVPYLIYGGKSYNTDELIHAIENDEPVGVDLMRNSIILSLDRFDRFKENLQDVTKL